MKKSILFAIFFVSCQVDVSPEPEKPDSMVVLPSKLEQLLSLPQDTVLAYFDLSHDFLLEFPDLSGYTIRSLNLSHNYLDTLKEDFLPKGIKVLDLSYNYLTTVRFYLEGMEELNLSHNFIDYFYTKDVVNRLDISYNNLKVFDLPWSYRYYYGYFKSKEKKQMSYLNISHNPRLSNEVLFVPSLIDTIIHDHIANQKKLRMADIFGRNLRV